MIRAVSQLAFATAPLLMNYGNDDDEFGKRIPAMLLTSKPFLVVDNANNKHISNDTLETALTEGEVDVRPLGRTELIHIVIRALQAATGNNIGLSGDMTRRALMIEVLPRSPTPEADVYPFRPDLYIIEHRNELLAAVFTLMRAFRQAGMPKLATTSAGSFPEWERRVRDAVIWMTGIDVVQQFARNRDNAVDKQTNAVLLRALFAVFGSNAFRASDALAIYDDLARDKRLQGALALLESLRIAWPDHSSATRIFLSRSGNPTLSRHDPTVERHR
jgi:hypothetical protein